MSDVNIHMVCSVKGGSGKTAYALHKVVKLATDNKTDKEKKKSVLYIDADVHSSETCSFLYRNFDNNMVPDGASETCRFIALEMKDSIIDSKKPKPKHYLNSYMHPYNGYYSKLEEIMLPAKINGFTVTDNKWELAEPPDGTVKMIFADPSPSGRAVFGNIFQTSGRSSIGVGTYISKARDLLKYVAKECGFTDIVVDMPPGSDTFSDHLRELIVELSADKDIHLTIYYVTNDDIGHIRSAASAASSHLHAMRSAHIHDVCLVYNRVRDESAVLNESGVKKKIKSLANDDRVAHELKRIQFEVFERDEMYYKSFKITEGEDAEVNKLVVFGNS